MAQLTTMILMLHYSVRDILQTRLEVNSRRWKQRKLHTTLSLLTMATKRTIVISIRYGLNYNFYVSGLPP